MTKLKADLILLFVTVLWGLGFIFTGIAVDLGLSPGAVNVFRGMIFMLTTLVAFNKKIFKGNRRDFKIAALAGVFNTLGFLFQTFGAKYTLPSNNAFLTVTNVIFVPIVAYILYKRKLQRKNLVAIIFCMIGMVILTGIYQQNTSFNIGDLLSLIGAVFYAILIVILSNSAKDVPVAVLSFTLGFMQMMGGVVVAIFDKTPFYSGNNVVATFFVLVYLGVFASFVCQSLQIFAQKHTTATSAALIMMLEGVFGSIFSVWFGLELFSSDLVIGGTLIVISLIFTEIEFKNYRIGKR